MTIGHRLRFASLSLALLTVTLVTAAGPSTERLTSKPRTKMAAVKAVPVGEEVRTGSNQRRRLVLPDGSVLYVNQSSNLKVVAERRLKLTAGEVLVEAAPAKEPFVIDTPKRQVAALGTTFAVKASDQGTGVVVARGKVKVNEVGGQRERIVSAGQRLTADGDKPQPSPRASELLDWARDLMIAAESPLVPASSYSGGSLTVLDPNGQEAKLSLRKYHVDVFIEDGFARTTIDQTYFNDTHGRLEGTFHFPLPPDASLSRLAMYVDGTCMEGGMVERDYGRNVYETIVTRQQDPALLEWVDGSTFKMRVFPLEPRQEKRIVLSYSQRLGSYAGQDTYRFPAGHSLEQVRDWSLHVQVKNGDKIGWNSPSHSLTTRREQGDLLLDTAEKNAKLDRDVVLTLGQMQAGAQTRFSMMEQEGAKYLMVRHRPDLPQRAETGRAPRDMVVLFESSGDRDPLLARAQVEIVRGLLQNAEPEDTFAVLTAATRTRSPMQERQRATPENIDSALNFLENAQLIGALNLDKGLTESVALLRDGRNPHLIHVGSGIAAMGEQRQDMLIKRIPDDVRYVGIGAGRRWNRNLMKAAAEKSGGLFAQINPDEPISWRAFELSNILNSPRLLDISVRDDSGKNRWLTNTSLVAQGEEVCAVTRLAQDLPEKITVRGMWQGRPLETVLDVADVTKEAGYLPRTWAKLEIDRLLAEDAGKHRTQIVELSKTMYVMSPFTSLLVLENEAMYQQYKVDRGRKDHWAMYDCPEKIAVVYEPEDGVIADPKKGVKPSVKHVLATISTRTGPPAVLKVAVSEPPIDFPPASRWGELSAGRSTERTERKPLNAIQTDALPAFGPAILSKIPYLDRLSKSDLRFTAGYDINSLGNVTRSSSPVQDSTIRNAVTQPNLILGQLGRHEPVFTGLQTEAVFTAPVGGSPMLLRQILGDRAGRPDGLAASDARHLLAQGFTSGEELARPIQVQEGEFYNAPGITGKFTGRDNSSLLYQRPPFSGDDRLFYDLVSYAPGMNTGRADMLAVLEAEAAPLPASKLGRIDAAARKLLDTGRGTGWRSLTIPAEGARPAVSIAFDGQGRYAYERTLFPGIRERVVCDGDTLWHLYPDLGIGAKRKLSRFHRMAFARFVPWALLRAEDLARGADLLMAGERTVAIVPHGIDSLKDGKGKPLSYNRLHLVFAEDGHLAEQQVVEMPSKKIVGRVVFSPKGDIRILDTQDKEVVALKGKLDRTDAPNLKPDVKDLVVLSLPYRSREHLIETRKLKDRRNDDLPFADALDLFAADFASSNSESLVKMFREAFHGRDQRQLGLYVLLAAAGQNLDGQNLDVLAEHRDESLAQYLALHTSPVLRQHASQWAVSSVQWGEGALRHLAVTHALLQRWQSPRVLDGNRQQRQVAIAAALDYAGKNRNSHFGFALLGLMTDRANEVEGKSRDASDVRAALAQVWQHFEKTPGLETAAKYERARALSKAVQRDEGRKAFLDLYASARKDDSLLLIDEDFHRALLGKDSEKDAWNPLIRETARQLIDKKQRGAVLALASQCWQLEDQPLAEDLLALVLDGVKERKEKFGLTVAVVEFLRGNGKLIEAERLLQSLLEDAEWSKRADLWRLAVQLAEGRESPARRMECLERALDAEYRDRPEVMKLNTIDSEYGRLMSHYQGLAEAMVTLKVKPPEDFLARVVRTADRWRSLSKNGNSACDTAARILRQFGERELAWDYLTTPVGLRPGSPEPWLGLAGTLRRQGELKLADEAFASAFAAEPTNAQILWDRVQNLRQSGNAVESKKLLRQLVDGAWQPRFQALVAQARWQLDQR